MVQYNLPSRLGDEIILLEERIERFKRKEISAEDLKQTRVPFGIYEQRKSGTYMIRIRCAAGAITPRQLEETGRIAHQFACPNLHLTSRQGLQIHYVRLDDIVPILLRLKEIGLATRGTGGNTVRNIVVPPDAGVDPQEVFDVSPYAVALTSRLIGEKDSWDLPRKFKIAFSGSGCDKGFAALSDVGFIAEVKNGKKGFRVYAAGGLGAGPETAKLFLDFIEADEVYAVTASFKLVFSKYGNRRNKHAARMRFLWNSLGEEKFRELFIRAYGDIKSKAAAPLNVVRTGDENHVRGLRPEAAGDFRSFELWKRRHVSGQKQAGRFLVSVPVQLGFIPSETTIRIGNFLRSFGENSLRLTQEQNFMIRNIPEEYLGNVYNFLKNQDEAMVNSPALYGKILACAGASTCQLGLCLSRQAAQALIDVLRKSELDMDDYGDIRLNISGCPNSCGRHLAADLGFSGRASRNGSGVYPAYHVFAGAVICDGRTKLAERAGEIAAKRLPDLVKDLLDAFSAKKKRFPGFREYITADEGKEDLKQICERYRQAPSLLKDQSYYTDWGSSQLFSLAGRGPGECAI